MGDELTDAASTLLEILTSRVRFLSVRQVERVLAGKAKQALRFLEREGLIEIDEVLIRPELPLDGPLFTWSDGDSEPNFGPLSYKLKSRWTDAVIPTKIVRATPKAIKSFGGFMGRRPRASELSHDLHVASMYLRYLEATPELANFWVSEEQQRAERSGQAGIIPDAVIRDAKGSILLIAEFGGSYGKDKLSCFHSELQHECYEIW